jgi:hypothetical protein
MHRGVDATSIRILARETYVAVIVEVRVIECRIEPFYFLP